MLATGEERGSPRYSISCRDFGAIFRNSKNNLLTAASRPRAILSSASPVRRGACSQLHNGSLQSRSDLTMVHLDHKVQGPPAIRMEGGPQPAKKERSAIKYMIFRLWWKKNTKILPTAVKMQRKLLVVCRGLPQEERSRAPRTLKPGLLRGELIRS
jgi:hypothetical protein